MNEFQIKKPVCNPVTRHLEVVRFKLLHVIFGIHNPITLNRQEANVREEYKSLIFYKSEEEKISSRGIPEFGVNGIWSNPILRLIKSLKNFHLADESHKNYFLENRLKLYFEATVLPRMIRFKQDSNLCRIRSSKS